MLRTLSILILLTFINVEAKNLRITLQQAIDLKLIKGEARSLGGYQEYCILLQLKNLTQDSLVILIEAGRRLKAGKSEYQDILIVKEEIVKLKARQQLNKAVRGFCCESGDRSPSKGELYGLNKLADTCLVHLAKFISSREVHDTGSEQSTIWAVSSGRSTGAIMSRNSSSQDDLRKLVSCLKGEEYPWYTLVTRVYTFQNGRISIIPLELKATVPYSTSSTKYATCYIFNAAGMPVGIMKSDWLPASLNGNYEVDVPVKGLPQGKYSLELKTEENSIIRRQFEL